MFDSKASTRLGGERLSSPSTKPLSVLDCNALTAAPRPDPIIRIYNPDAAAVDVLVEALHRLLVEAASETPTIVPAHPEPACFRSAPE